MSRRRKHIKTEHAGAKHGKGFWGRKVEAKEVSSTIRRINDKEETEEQMTSFCGSDNDENDYEIGYREGAVAAFGIMGMFAAIRYRDMRRRYAEACSKVIETMWRS